MIRYISPIDPHVHLRGEEYPNNDFLTMGLEDAMEVGLRAVIEQPNPTPWLTTPELVEERKEKAKKIIAELVKKDSSRKIIRHGVHIGLTNDIIQVERALRAVMENRAGLNSDKIFYVHSTGNMGILDQDFQRKIWMLKGRMDYKGVSIGHFEDEAKFIGEFDYRNPISHSERQTEESETIQVERQIRNAVDARFKGIFYIAHVSSPATVEYIEREQRNLPFRVIKEITAHHSFLNTKDYRIHGNRVKMNPPLRSPRTQEKLLEDVISEKFEVIGTDHAPHTIGKKDSNEPPSGIPALPIWPFLIGKLREYGINEAKLEDMTFNYANRLFKLGLTARFVEKEYNPSLWNKYGYNPFSRIDH